MTDRHGEELFPDLPPRVRWPLMWRMSVRLVTDHRPWPVGIPWRDRPVCRGCRDTWPCGPYLLGRRGLAASLTPRGDLNGGCGGLDDRDAR